MVGFELNVHGKKMYAAVEKGVVSVIVTSIMNDAKASVELDLTGLDTSGTEGDASIAWYNAVLNIGDEFTVRVVDISEASKPIIVKDVTAPLK